MQACRGQGLQQAVEQALPAGHAAVEHNTQDRDTTCMMRWVMQSK